MVEAFSREALCQGVAVWAEILRGCGPEFHGLLEQGERQAQISSDDSLSATL